MSYYQMIGMCFDHLYQLLGFLWKKTKLEATAIPALSPRFCQRVKAFQLVIPEKKRPNKNIRNVETQLQYEYNLTLELATITIISTARNLQFRLCTFRPLVRVFRFRRHHIPEDLKKKTHASTTTHQLSTCNLNNFPVATPEWRLAQLQPCTSQHMDFFQACQGFRMTRIRHSKRVSISDTSMSKAPNEIKKKCCPSDCWNVCSAFLACSWRSIGDVFGVEIQCFKQPNTTSCPSRPLAHRSSLKPTSALPTSDEHRPSTKFSHIRFWAAAAF